MSTNCFITFDHADGVYNSGETINGHIKLHTSKIKSIRGIYIKLRGYADVQWEERKCRMINLKTEYYSINYKTHEQYLNSITYVVGQDCGDSFDLLPGIYEHAFSSELPRELPTTCNEIYGKIKYEVSVKLNSLVRI